MTCEIDCPKCGHMQEYDDDNDTILCDECNELIFIEEVTEIDRTGTKVITEVPIPFEDQLAREE